MTALTAEHTYLNFGSIEHQPAEVCELGDVCEGLWVEAVTGGQIELLQSGTSLGDDLQTGFIQEVTARHFQADQAETTGFQKTEAGDGETEHYK